MSIQGPSRQPVYDPNDVPRTTIKETNIHDNNGGYMSIQGPARQPVYDPNDVPRTTIKETIFMIRMVVIRGSRIIQ